MHTSRKVAAAVAAGVMVALAGAAHSATKTDGFTVSVTVEKNCVIDAADMDFGVFVGDNDRFATSDITVACTANTPYSVALSTGSSASFTARRMTFGADQIFYNLYTSGAYAAVWGDGADSSSVVVPGTGAGMSTPQTLTVHGRLLASDNTGAIADGLYTDSITATITY